MRLVNGSTTGDQRYSLVVAYQQYSTHFLRAALTKHILGRRNSVRRKPIASISTKTYVMDCERDND